MDDSVVYTALPGRYVVQEKDDNGWTDVESFDNLDAAKEEAQEKARLLMNVHRVVERTSYN